MKYYTIQGRIGSARLICTVSAYSATTARHCLGTRLALGTHMRILRTSIDHLKLPIFTNAFLSSYHFFPRNLFAVYHTTHLIRDDVLSCRSYNIRHWSCAPNAASRARESRPKLSASQSLFFDGRMWCHSIRARTFLGRGTSLITPRGKEKDAIVLRTIRARSKVLLQWSGQQFLPAPVGDRV